MKLTAHLIAKAPENIIASLEAENRVLRAELRRLSENYNELWDTHEDALLEIAQLREVPSYLKPTTQARIELAI